MCQFIESIKVENRTFHNITFHQERLNSVFKHFYPNNNPFQLSDIKIPNSISNELYKCRIVYSQEIITIEFSLYTFRTIKSLKIVEDNTVDYSYKYANRNSIDNLQALKDDKDDILIIKNGFVTDTSYNNIVFYDGTHWITPTTYLLAGTKRAQLLAEGKIIEKEIKREDISKFEKAVLINCFNDLENGQIILSQNIS